MARPCQCWRCQLNRLEDEVALELKGIKGDALKAAAHLDRIRAAYRRFNEAAPAHAADVESLTPQIEALQEDMTFAATLLGNSAGQSGESEKPMDSLKPPSATQPAPTNFDAPAAIPELPRAIPRMEVGPEQSAIFQPADPLQAR